MTSRQTNRKRIVLTSAGSPSTVAMTFVHIPACPGGFLMGDRGVDAAEEPVHRVVISEDFWLGETPVTQAQFDVWPGAAKRGEDHWPAGNSTHPAINLSWNDAVQYCDWLTRIQGRKFPKGFSSAELPCEAQWEYACRAPLDIRQPSTDYHSGDGDTALQVSGWYSHNSGSRTHPVQQLTRNDFGLYDMHGNVWEWCLDRWDASAYRRRWDGISDRRTFELNNEFGDRSENEYRVLRGGSYGFTADTCRSAYRFRFRAGGRFRVNGFRVCLVRSPFVSQTSGG